MTSVRFKVQFGKHRESRLTAPPSPTAAAVAPTAAQGAPPLSATPIARLLALAHHIERLVEAGEVKDYAEAARRLGMVKSHMTHVTNLLSLAPDIQAAILEGRMTTTEHALRPACRLLAWDVQQAALVCVQASAYSSKK